MENSFKTVIENAGSVAIFLPTKAHLDDIASALSLYLALKDSKPVQIVAPSPVTVSFNRLIGIDIITQGGKKNLVIGFSNYDANSIERVSYDIIDNQFKLTVIPKSGINPPGESQVNISYEGVSADTVILFGGVTDINFPQLATKGLESTKMYHVGTRPLTVDPSRIVYTFAQPMASVSELTFFLLNEAQLQVGTDVATNLLMGIEDATQNYKSPEAGAETFEVTASLIRLGGRRLAGAGIDKSLYPAGSIPQKQVGSISEESKIGTLPVSPADFADFSQESETKKESIPIPKVQEKVKEEESQEVLNPPDDWLQPKVYRGTSLN